MIERVVLAIETEAMKVDLHVPTSSRDITRRLAIAAMRELRTPTKAMLDAGAIKMHRPFQYGELSTPYPGESGGAIRERMIDEALK